MQRASANGKFAVVTAGAVSVAPHEPATGISLPGAYRTARASRRMRSAAGSAAAALNSSRSREKKRPANSGSPSSTGTS